MVGEDRVQSYDTFDLPIQALISGDVGAVIMDEEAAKGFVEQNPDKIMLLSEPITGAEELGFVFPPGSDLVGPFDYAITELEANGTLDTLYNKYWGQQEEKMPGYDLGGAEIRVGVENAYPPFNYIDEATNEPGGWDYDAVRAICDLINCTPVLPYMVIAQYIVVRSDESVIVDEASLIASDVIVGTQIGTTNEAKAIELVGEDRVQRYDTFDLPIQALISGDVGAVIMDEEAAKGFVDQNPDKIMLLPNPVTGAEELGFVFPPGSGLVEPFNYAIAELDANGMLDTLYDRYWGE
ncbi:MAG: transporter substrate-binding domain-containing protein [Anaerolineales bacterium]